MPAVIHHGWLHTAALKSGSMRLSHDVSFGLGMTMTMKRIHTWRAGERMC
jgi:hypothetical protein